MINLSSKIQYSDFEVGEFVEEKPRTYTETIALIEAFPWQTQREKLVIDITNPSVTIQGINNDYLKLAVFYNGKFVLRYLDNKQVLFTKSLFNIPDSYEYLKQFFAGNFTPAQWKKESTWRNNNLKHFLTQDFRFTVTPQRIKYFLWITGAIQFIFPISFAAVTYLIPVKHADASVIIIMLVAIVSAGIYLNLFLNHYRHSKGKVLVMSKGNETFYYGNTTNPVRYYKADIIQFTSIRSRNGKSPASGIALINIVMKDGSIIKIPNLLVDDTNLRQKLFRCRRVDKVGYSKMFIRSLEYWHAQFDKKH